MENLQVIEDGMIKVYRTDKGEYVVDGRELWQGVESKQEFAHWVKSRLNECDAEEINDYFTFDKKIKREKSGATMLKEYIIKLDTAKEMAMLERNDKGKQYRRYLLEVEKKYKAGQSAIPDGEYQLRLQEVKIRQADIILQIANDKDNARYKQILQSKAVEIMTGEQYLPLPALERKSYSAAEIGQKLNISANMVGKIANKHNLKTQEFGFLAMSVDQRGAERETWRYYIEVLEPLRQCLDLEKKLKEEKKKAKAKAC